MLKGSFRFRRSLWRGKTAMCENKSPSTGPLVITQQYGQSDDYSLDFFSPYNARWYIHFKQSVGAPQGSFRRGTSVVEEVADKVIEPGAWKLVLLSNCPYRCLEALSERRVRGALHIFMQHVNVIGRGSIVNLREHECPSH